MRPNWPEWIARAVVHHRRGLVTGIVIAVLACIGLLIAKLRLDPDILNLLPQRFDSVQGLKLYNNEFSQAKELTFVLNNPAAATDDTALEEFEAFFVEGLRKQPWAVRVFSGSPLETPEGMEDLRSLSVPLLLNLDEKSFAEALRKLEPVRLQERVALLRRDLESGSPRAEFELTIDPMGIVFPSMAPLSGSSALENAGQILSSDKSMRLIPVVIRLKNFGDIECRRLMGEVHAFIDRAVQEWNADGGKAPQVMVTGRAAFVAEVSESMLWDLGSTLLSSVLLVCGLFYMGFRRLLPLVGIVSILVLVCLLSLTAGALLFDRLNVITIGFCSILVGLGVDFGLLLCGAYEENFGRGANHESAIRESVGKVGGGIFYGGLTTAAAFLSLLLSGSQGFSQLGVLVAIGIVLCALLMCGLLFLFVRERPAHPGHDGVKAVSKLFLDFVQRAPKKNAIVFGAILCALALVAVTPFLPIPFDFNPKALQPKNSNAAKALEVIDAKMLAGGEPLLLLVAAENASQFHQYWVKIEARLAELKRSGKIRSYSVPLTLTGAPERIGANRAQLKEIDFEQAKSGLLTALDTNNFVPEEFGASLGLLDKLKAAASAEGVPDFRAGLPESSSWLFVFDQFFASKPFTAAGYMVPLERVRSVEKRDEMMKMLEGIDVPLRVSGWSFTMIDLIPWTKGEFYLLSSLVGGVILVILGLVYRSWRFWLIHSLSLGLALLAVVATVKLFDVKLNLLNVLAFPLVLGVGVDYGIHVLLAVRNKAISQSEMASLIKSVLLSGLTTVCGFGSLVWAQNPSLRGLGAVTALGVFWSLFATLCFLLPAALIHPKNRENPPCGNDTTML